MAKKEQTVITGEMIEIKGSLARHEIVRKVGRLVLNVVLVPIGIVGGSLTTYLTLWVLIYDVPVYIMMSFVIMTTLMLIQLPCLMLFAWFLKRITKLPLCFSYKRNLMVSFSFPIFYLLSIVAIDRTRFLSDVSTDWFEFIVLPAVVFIPLGSVIYLLPKSKKAGCPDRC